MRPLLAVLIALSPFEASAQTLAIDAPAGAPVAVGVEALPPPGSFASPASGSVLPIVSLGGSLDLGTPITLTATGTGPRATGPAAPSAPRRGIAPPASGLPAPTGTPPVRHPSRLSGAAVGDAVIDPRAAAVGRIGRARAPETSDDGASSVDSASRFASDTRPARAGARPGPTVDRTRGFTQWSGLFDGAGTSHAQDPVDPAGAAGEDGGGRLPPLSSDDIGFNGGGGEPAPPAPPERPEARRSVGWMIAGTAAMKLGMEVVGLSVPLFALQALGGATYVALLAIVFGLSQVAFSTFAGALTDRLRASRVLAGAVVAQASLVALTLALSLLTAHPVSFLPHIQWFQPWMVFPIYALIGGAAGIAETARRLVAPLILGRDEEALKRYNARVHIFYESSGVIGALAAGALIAWLGPLTALLLNPPAYALAAIAFWKVRHVFEPRAPSPRGPGAWARAKAGVGGYLEDLKLGMRTVLGDKRLRWVAIAMVLPQVVHRVFENVMLPVFAARVLHSGATSAVLLTASNLGELVGAAILLRLASRIKGPFAWARLSAVGLLALWVLSATTSLPLLLPLILAFSLTWASSDLSLMSYLQSSLPEKTEARAMSFLFGAFIATVTVVSFLIGRFMDLAPMHWALVGILAAFTGLAALVWRASARLRR